MNDRLSHPLVQFWLLLAALSLLGLGMMLTLAGVLVGPLFLPGVLLIAIAMAAFAATGLLRLRGADRDQAAPAATPREPARRKE
jgi:hypothetical protein